MGGDLKGTHAGFVTVGIHCTVAQGSCIEPKSYGFSAILACT